MTAKARCCCTETPCSGTCAFASSYSVSGIEGSYSFSRQQGPQGCGNVCFTRSFSLNLTWSQVGALVVSKVTSTGGVAPCCYHGEGTLVVSGTLTITEIYEDGICADQTETYTYTFERDVPCAVTVSCGGQHACGFSTADPPGWTHTLHICDFLVTCSHEGFEGDCDTCYEPYGPFALRCVGGTVSYLSAIVAPDAIAASGCLGWYARQQCGDAPFPEMLNNTGIVGPFGIVADGECSQQDEYESCTLGNVTAGFLYTRVDSDPLASPWLADPASTTKSACGSTDWSGGPSASCTIDIIQGGCSGAMPWEYA
jgi:hypothetical protein